MVDTDNISHLLDILGNKNRRRIVELLRKKPCFVTEISNLLSINPKVVNEHLNLMRKEDVVSSYQDDKRHKYYYLVHDFTVSVQMNDQRAVPVQKVEESNQLPLMDKILILKKLLTSREHMIETLEAVEEDIDKLMNEVVVSCRSVFDDTVETEILLALVYAPLTPIELADTCNSTLLEVTAALPSLVSRGYIVMDGERYTLASRSSE